MFFIKSELSVSEMARYVNHTKSCKKLEEELFFVDKILDKQIFVDGVVRFPRFFNRWKLEK